VLGEMVLWDLGRVSTGCALFLESVTVDGFSFAEVGGAADWEGDIGNSLLTPAEGLTVRLSETTS